METNEKNQKWEGAGGTPGGVGQFLVGLGMAVAGAYLLASSVIVSSGFWTVRGYNAFGLSLLPLSFGIGLLFFNGRSKVGWLLLFVGNSDHLHRHHHESANLLPVH